ncbi:MAG: uracil-DNA glycosylase [Rhodoblastus sp.]|nr:MAG: uracil-DNA glycosylase [Rhodoblastus sp.]
MSSAAEPTRDCPLCPRLAAFRAANREAFPEFFNAPAPIFGGSDARLLIVGLAPGLKGANATGRPFTGDYAGVLLYETLLDFGFARGVYAARPDDGLRLIDARIVNAVRCAPPQNKPTPQEARTCRSFLAAALAETTRLTAIVTLGRVAHENALRAAGARPASAPFAHGAEAKIDVCGRLATVLSSYHCSRYNTNTGVLTREMFRAVFARARTVVDAA